MLISSGTFCRLNKLFLFENNELIYTFHLTSSFGAFQLHLSWPVLFMIKVWCSASTCEHQLFIPHSSHASFSLELIQSSALLETIK